MDVKSLFEAVVATEEELRAIVGVPNEAVVKKTVNVIDEHIRHFIARSPLFFLSTAHENGSCDVSPRGGDPGYVQVWDEKHLIFPERPGNRRVDSLLNILSNSQVGMLFLIPGMEEVLRINGRARIIQTGHVLEQLKKDNQIPPLGVVVEVEECFVHCPRALNASAIWNSSMWPEKEELPSAKEMFQAHLKINGYTLG
ncbi:MSMEG_1061 family FMN-dependent PPOX-type flavoprotein [Paenibacillus turpanensis]|uniref:MSMEG_1061 family FMN-dependent PPOX-type flavoprotein n=1 Tax=Paenibacillus turpanensis TaxID=2689078 RepID=UPI0014079426|nr:MSMEG_1061 family FMN-dependent PPOX-type flavoprotein [Paenibacillus turpanensis]